MIRFICFAVAAMLGACSLESLEDNRDELQNQYVSASSKRAVFEDRTAQEDAFKSQFQKKYWHEEREPVHVNGRSSDSLFSSRYTLNSGIAWPSFSSTIKRVIETKLPDRYSGARRLKLTSERISAHLGYIFRRYINFASLTPVPANNLRGTRLGTLLTRFGR